MEKCNELIGLNGICRLCLSKDCVVMKPIFTTNFDQEIEVDMEQDKSEYLAEIILHCVGLKIQPNDELPQQICDNCFKILQSNYNFRLKCQKAAAYLNSIKLNVNAENYEDIVSKKGNLVNDIEIDSKITLKRNEDQCSVNEDEIDCQIQLEKSDTSEEENKHKIKRKRKLKGGKRGRPPNPQPSENYGRYSGMCQICGALRRDLRVHIMSHGKTREFLCDICGKDFKNKSGILKHILSIHINARNHKCHLCPMAFNNKYCLTKHLRIHLDERKYKCEFCKKTFLIAHGLYLHLRTHTQERRHRCEYCSKTFVTSGNLKSHIGIHTGERPFKCGLCPKTFVNTSSAAMHRKIHFNGKAHKCELCTGEFTTMSNFRIHMKIDHQIVI